jgi:hypothetical protein
MLLGLVFYALYYKNINFFILNLVLLSINLYIYGTDIGGYPTGHFLDALGVYAAIFSPIVFVYMVYVLYRVYLSKDYDIVWFISTTTLIFSLLLSLRQRVHI